MLSSGESRCHSRAASGEGQTRRETTGDLCPQSQRLVVEPEGCPHGRGPGEGEGSAGADAA